MGEIKMAKNGTNDVTRGVNAQTGVLTDVPLGKPDHFRWVPLISISAGNQANQEHMGYRFDRKEALRQHRDMVDAYAANGVCCHFVAAHQGLGAAFSPVLPAS